jgi:hypothetical protein
MTEFLIVSKLADPKLPANQGIKTIVVEVVRNHLRKQGSMLLNKGDSKTGRRLISGGGEVGRYRSSLAAVYLL